MNEPRTKDLRERIVDYVTIAIVALPDSGGVSWNEAQEIAANVADRVLASDGRHEPFRFGRYIDTLVAEGGRRAVEEGEP